MSIKNSLPAVLLLHLCAIAPALAEECREAGQSARAGSRAPPCRPIERLRPYEPDRVRAGRTPGFIDLGNGAEVKVDGSVRFEGDVRRR